jgi:PKD repeat protein
MVQDANGCIDSDTIELTAPPLLGLTLDSIVGVDCEGDFSGEIHVTGIGGTPSYNYFLDGASLQSNGDYIGLSDGIYSVSIMDVNGCTFAEDVAVVATQMLPTADFNFTISGTAVSFDNQSAFGDTYLWEFDDDSTRTDMSPIHVYDEDGEYNVTLTVTNACGSENITILVSTTTIGISDNEMLSFGLYPNPASNQLFIQPSKSVNTELTLEVISTSGQLILSKQIARIDVTETVQLDVNGLSNGLYYLKIVGNEQQLVLRFDIIK